MKIGAVVILYHPDSELNARILTYLPYIEKLYIFDNTDNADNSELISGLGFPGKVVYYTDRENKGISLRLNQALELARSESLSWLLTMDQDSYFDGDNFSNYIKCINDFQDPEAVGMFGVRFHSKPENPFGCSFIETTLMITSGSVINLKQISKIGQFDEALFIDQVDIDFCYKIISAGCKIIQFTSVHMYHSLGHIASYRSIVSLGKKTKRSLHSPIRLYYMTRNYLYMRDKYKNKFPAEVHHTKEDLLNRIKNNLLYSRNRLAVVRNILSGFADYKKGKMGKKK
jgi:rhamnosyltransferase